MSAQRNVGHVYNGIRLSHYKERNRAICRDVDGPRGCHTEWSKSERGQQTSHINVHMWDLGKRNRLSHLENRNRDTDIENKCTDTKGEVLGLGDRDWHIYRTRSETENEWEPTVKYREPYSMLCGDINGKEIEKRGVHVYICVCTADSLCYMSETNTTRQTTIPQ